MRVFLCEYVTGGGFVDNPLPASLAREGLMMRDALARDLAERDGVALVVAHDARFPPPAHGQAATVGGGDAWGQWAAVARDVDLAWVVAPETGGLLGRLSRLCRDAGCAVAGSDDEAIRICSSKRATADRLRSHGVATVPTWPVDAIPDDAAGPFVTKPDDGAGCEATRFWVSAAEAAQAPPAHVAQPYLDGDAASLTVLRAGDQTLLLTANRQHVAIQDGAFAFSGVTVGAIDDRGGGLAALAGSVARALPGLDGLFGIDVVLTAGGPVVIEINPRVTTSHVGLRESLGMNPLALVAPFGTPPASFAPARRPVEVTV